MKKNKIILGLMLCLVLSDTSVYAESKASKFDDISIVNNRIEVTQIVEKEVIKEVYVDAPNSYPFELKDLGTFSSTAYCPCSKCCGASGGKLEGKTGALGMGVYVDTTIAVDPKVIPLGSKVYIEGLGVRIAVDTGGAIKGKKLDLYMATHKEALNWGRKKVKVYLIQE